MSFSSNRGSFEILNVVTRWGLSPLADQIRCTVAGLTPACLAIDRHDQCVASLGLECWVNSTISATFSSLIDGFRPRPVATSPNPVSPSWVNCARHASTVGRDTPATSLISEFDTPSAADNSTRARCTTRCAATRECAKLSKICRCPSDTANGVAIRLILHSITNRKVICKTLHYRGHWWPAGKQAAPTRARRLWTLWRSR
jgi:hypothetical protein